MRGQRQHAELDTVVPLPGHGKDTFYSPTDRRMLSGQGFQHVALAVGPPEAVSQSRGPARLARRLTRYDEVERGARTPDSTKKT